MSVLHLEKVGHAYFGRTILSGIDLDIKQGELVALAGPSGCGKSTLAHIAAGLVDAKEGRIIRSYTRRAMMFQDPALLPWAVAADNIAYPLRLARYPRAKRRDRVEKVAQMVSLLPEDLQKYPVELSGGMRQRVSIARALALNPDFIFFDEPFTALDVALRRRMQDLVIRTCASGQLSGLFITHDLAEAARVAHRVAVLDTQGRGITGIRTIDGAPGSRSETDVFNWTRHVLAHDPIFRHIHDVDERQIV